jgi:predicted dinucleotide-binding enzyme
MRGLWDHPDRVKWFGGGYDTPGIHSICVDPRNAQRIQVGVSCGGAWTSDDDGATAEIGTLSKKLGFSPIELGGLSEGGLLVGAHGNSWGRLIFKDLFKFD